MRTGGIKRDASQSPNRHDENEVKSLESHDKA